MTLRVLWPLARAVRGLSSFLNQSVAFEAFDNWDFDSVIWPLEIFQGRNS